MADEQPVGRRVAYWRNRRKMSQQVFADRLGKSKSWVDKVERGVRRLDRFSIFAEIAEVLQLDVQLLMNREIAAPPPGRSIDDDSGVDAIRAALERYDKVVSFGGRPATAPPLVELGKAVGHTWLTYSHSGYRALARVLPGLIRDAQAANAHYRDTDGDQAAHLLSQVYQIASSSLRMLGENDLAWLAAERAVTAGQQAHDEVLLASAIAHVVAALAALGRLRPALELSISAASHLAPSEGVEAGPAQLSIFGNLILQGALTAAKLGDAATAGDLAGAAEAPAKRLGRDESYHATTFGPTALLVHRVAAAIELGEMVSALSTHAAIDADAFAAMTLESRAHHLLNLARAHSQLGDLPAATNTLVDAVRLAPTELRHHPLTDRLLAEILRRSPGGASPALTTLTDMLSRSVPMKPVDARTWG